MNLTLIGCIEKLRNMWSFVEKNKADKRNRRWNEPVPFMLKVLLSI